MRDDLVVIADSTEALADDEALSKDSEAPVEIFLLTRC